jgi:hypothetical protein
VNGFFQIAASFAFFRAANRDFFERSFGCIRDSPVGHRLLASGGLWKNMADHDIKFAWHIGHCLHMQ